MPSTPPPGEGVKRAAQYLRMSTEHQRYSIEHQKTAIALYATANAFEIVATYADEGVSGLTIKRREGLRRLLADVLAGGCGFETILVYDVSRWGRFQNPDQSAHYEFMCAEAGVKVEYCAELFRNDGSMPSTILKGLKRVMAAEYSRELSAKTSAAKTRYLERGFWQGGSAGYGLRRRMVRPDGELDRILERGEMKAIQGYHTILVPGPPEEIAIVERIYRMFAEVGHSRPGIARILNQEGVPSESGRPWTYHMIDGVLRNPKYVGDLVGNRTTGFLGGPRLVKERDAWVHAAAAFAPIISHKLFDAAARRRALRRPVELSYADLIMALRGLYSAHGKITARLIDETPGLPCSGKVRRMVGSTHEIYLAIGVQPQHAARRPKVIVDDAEMLRRLAELLARSGHLSKSLVDLDPNLPASTTVGERLGGLRSAYARVGFVPMTHRQRVSKIGRARQAAAAHLLRTSR